MSIRTTAMILGALLCLAAVPARAQEAPGQPVDVAAPAAGEEFLEPAAGAADQIAPRQLTDEEIESLERLADQEPELADKAGGYVSNEDLLTIILVVLLIMLIF